MIGGVILLSSCDNSSTIAMMSESLRERTEVTNEIKCNPILPGLLDKRCDKNYQLGQCDIRESTLKDGLENREIILNVVEGELSDCISDLKSCRDTLNKPSLSSIVTPREIYFGIGGIGIGVLGLWTCQNLIGTKKAKKPLHRTPTVSNEPLSIINEPLPIIIEEGTEQASGDMREEATTTGTMEENLHELSQIVLQNSDNIQTALEKLEKTEETRAIVEELSRENDELKSRLSEVESVTLASSARGQE